MNLNFQNKNSINNINTLRDLDNNIISVTSSDKSYLDLDQFIEIDNSSYSYNDIGLINYNFEEFSISTSSLYDEINAFFTTYNNIKSNINVFGTEQSHEYIFNSTKDVLNRNNLTIVDSYEYSDLIIKNSNLVDDLSVKDEILNAEKELYERQLTALYETVNSIKVGSINIIDNILLPIAQNNEQLKHSFNSLKIILNQSIDYLLENKSSLAIKKTTINDFDIKDVKGSKVVNNTIIYNYLNDEQYIRTAYDKLININMNDIMSQVTNLENKIKELEKQNRIKDYENAKIEIDNLNLKIQDMKNILSILANKVIDSVDDFGLIKIYNNIYSTILDYINVTMAKIEKWMETNNFVVEDILFFNNSIQNKIDEFTNYKTIYLNNTNYEDYYKLTNLCYEYLLVIHKIVSLYFIDRVAKNKSKIEYFELKLLNTIFFEFKSKILSINSNI